MEFEVVMPRFGSEMTQGTIVEWLKKEGDQVEEGEALCLVDTEKAVLEVESEVAGILKKILASEKEVVPVGQPIATIETKG